MTGKLLARACAVCALTVALTAAVSSARSHSVVTLTFKGVATPFRFVDAVPRGESAGDMFVFGRALRANGKPAGRAQFVCVEADASRHAQQCSGTLRLRDGNLAVEGAVVGDTKRAQFAITGGTGAFVGRIGSLTTMMGPKDTSTLVVRLVG